ncbi:phosphoglucosamine mutase [Catelliglobosispora koreensis]|uniref:phosphoglucosamine mutase n=1 Tax=Catelliglobosispora koreensis TaxID=129052 RepID=UPI00037FF786|nr:phosphoglucosamine mutase [Catelliglobosispora koreensis]
MGRLFGTDGVRGLANADLSPELAMSIAMAAVRTLAKDRTEAPLALVGRDPRASSEMLEAAVIAGLASAGANVVRVGVLPTPGVAFLTAEVKADLGIMLSASHNPMPDNGIKLFAPGGHKLTDEVEDAIEALLKTKNDGWTRPTGARIGRVHELMDGHEHYLAHLVNAASHPLTGLKIVLDCANGAASEIGPEVFRQAGAEVIAIHAEPDGLNINDNCGSTHLDSIKAAVLEHQADFGLAVDGDADRCLAIAHDGSEVDGDQLMAILALAMKEAGTLTEDTLVATVMSNLGLKIAMREAGITLVEAKVGDRYVLDELRGRNLALGGEQSGHVVMPAFATTGDGVLCGLMVACRMAATSSSLKDLAGVVKKLPQVMINVRVGDKKVASAASVLAAVNAAEAQLSGSGRVLLRPSGTEPLIRVMVEAGTEDEAMKIAEGLAAEVRSASPA